MIINDTKLAGVIGWPIKHSKSPQVHNYWIKAHSINGVYVPLRVQPEKLFSALKLLPNVGFVGFNITLPHKERAIELMDIVEPSAKRIGAVNTVVVGTAGELIGSNTDSSGFLSNIRDNIPNWNPEGSVATVIGAGGACRAVIVGLIDSKVSEIRLINRTYSKSMSVVKMIQGPIKAYKWENMQSALNGSDLVVNTTSLGMNGQPKLKISLENVSSNAIISDIVYTPLITPLLKQAQTLNLQTVDGLGMLLHQACPGFNSWFGTKPSVTPMLKNYIISKDCG